MSAQKEAGVSFHEAGWREDGPTSDKSSRNGGKAQRQLVYLIFLSIFDRILIGEETAY